MANNREKTLRKVVRLTMMFKVASGLSAIQFPLYLYYLKGDRALGNSYPKKFIQVAAKTNKYQQSFIGRTIRNWNSLPNSVIEKQLVEAF